MEKKTVFLILLCIIAISSIVTGAVLNTQQSKKKKTKKQPTYDIKQEEKLSGDSIFTLNFLKSVNNNVEENTNYLVSPYSVEIALQMLKAGANSTTYDEINNLIGNRKINNINVKNKISTANAVFIKENYKYLVNTSYQDILKKDYNSEVLYDEYQTPKVINDWVSKKTNKMINNLLNEIDPDFVLGLANATAIDVKWQIPFDCIDTIPSNFLNSSNEYKKVQMMNHTYEGRISYFENNKGKGVIIPYQMYDSKGETVYEENENATQLEFIAILPNTTPKEYLSNLTQEELQNITTNKKDASSKINIRVALPKFDYDFTLKDFKKTLQELGMKTAFTKNKADFSNIIKKENANLYVQEAIHKTKISLNEEGTKAAAVTYFGMSDITAMEDPVKPQIISIEFNKPFIYMIRDKKSEEILFFGTVYEPLEWEKDTKSCSDIE